MEKNKRGGYGSQSRGNFKRNLKRGRNLERENVTESTKEHQRNSVNSVETNGQSFNKKHPFHQQTNKQKKKQYFTFNRLNELSGMADEEVMTIIAEKEDEFGLFLFDNNMKPDFVVLTFRILTQVCRSNFTEIKSSILNQACSTNLLKKLENYLLNLPFENATEKKSNLFYNQDIPRFWFNLVEFFKKVIELIPKTACDKLIPVVTKINQIIPTINDLQKYKIDNDIEQNMKSIKKDLEEELKQMEEKIKLNKATTKEEQFKEQDPPDNFRELSIIPTIQDFIDDKPFLRPCKTKDAYDSIEHYLDIQFRLLREDFIKPLRNGIHEFFEENYKKRNSDLHIYKNVKLEQKGVGIQIFFGKMKSVKWDRSKRFMFGSLLLLCRDDFKTILFTTVSNRLEKDLAEGYVTIEPCEGTVITPDMYKLQFVLLESKIYFEPYFKVLTAMKNICDDNFPMEKYFIKAATTSCLPYYLGQEPVLKFKGKFDLPISLNKPWPTALELQLDESQYKAFESAITEEFAIIQGPPGTGKTFLALEIVRTLLENKEHWADYGPILVVCLTNHALDQFLEGILKHTDSIVRVGSRSKSEALKPFSLMERRKLFKKDSNVQKLLFKKHREVEGVLNSMQKLRMLIEFLKMPNVIVPLSCFEYCNYFPQNQFTSSYELMFWLANENSELEEINLANEYKELLEKIIPNANLVQETNLEEEVSEDENEYADDKLFFNLGVQLEDNCKLINPTDCYNSLIEHVQLRISNLKAEKDTNVSDENLAKYTSALESFITKRKSLQDELMLHPLINTSNSVTSNPRWRQYWSWILISYEEIFKLIFEKETEHRQLNAELDELKQLSDLNVMRGHEIIGLTTTRAASIQATLKTLKAPIVLVEEAAEILESHVVCSISKDCQHVILIGDHKQLRPKASVYELGTKYNMNVSLFERMVNIRGNCIQLAQQHRMRPQIAKLITPSIYPNLFNHQSVLTYPDVRSVENNVFFLDHVEREEHYNDESWKNQHEVEFLTTFAKHLIMQGYKPSEITILSTYTGQMFAFMNKILGHSLLKGIRATTVDNYQGEENKIILLSLVRNNGEGNIGFLKEENRVCVALSRAREGLYIMGNMSDLVKKKNIWTEIKNVLEADGAIGNSLKLRCRIHLDQVLEVKKARDFNKCPQGGCLRTCNLLLACGHFCASVCHVLDREHKDYLCKQACPKTCPEGHPCPLKCYENCRACVVKVKRQLKCEHIIDVPCSIDPNTVLCPVMVDVTLPDCKHEMKKPCYLSIDKCVCPHDCEIRLSCGHSCQGKCHVRPDPDHLDYKCTKDCVKLNFDCTNNHICRKRCYEECNSCSEKVNKKRFCGHFYRNVACSLIVDDQLCQRLCNRELPCGHKCKQKCSENCGNCQEQVEKISSCGHTNKVKCCEEALSTNCTKKCNKILPCGHPCTLKCKQPCNGPCKIMVQLKEPGLCGHIFSVPCYLQSKGSKSHELLKYCSAPCTIELECKHPCSGTCKSCFQKRIHVSCDEPCRNVFICGHSCSTLCNQECQPCSETCNFQCTHNKCNRKCGLPCVPCVEQCDLKCKHKECTKKCHELCDIEPCTEACDKKLECGHSCIGFCGDPCPPFCKICNYDDLIDFDTGNKDNEDARFIFLKECGKKGHCIESETFLMWIKSESAENSDGSKEIKMPVCPQCKTPIKSCLRIMNLIKNNLKDLAEVKEKIFSKNNKDLKEKHLKYIEEVNIISEKAVLCDSIELKNFIQNLKLLIMPVRNKRKQELNYYEVNALKNFIQLLIEILSTWESVKKSQFPYQFIKDQIKFLVEAFPTKLQLSKQRLTDIQLEMRRLQLLVKVYNLFHEFSYTATNAKYFDNMAYKLIFSQRFTDDVEANLLSVANKISEKRILIEREEIIRAMNLSKGHYFKCPNGHFFAIGECGGAMQIGRCIECKAPVGGQNHALLTTNSLASEIDGATQPAYPTLVYERPNDFEFD